MCCLSLQDSRVEVPSECRCPCTKHHDITLQQTRIFTVTHIRITGIIAYKKIRTKHLEFLLNAEEETSLYSSSCSCRVVHLIQHFLQFLTHIHLKRKSAVLMLDRVQSFNTLKPSCTTQSQNVCKYRKCVSTCFFSLLIFIVFSIVFCVLLHK